jgi:hypothetical protein
LTVEVPNSLSSLPSPSPLHSPAYMRLPQHFAPHHRLTLDAGHAGKHNTCHQHAFGPSTLPHAGGPLGGGEGGGVNGEGEQEAVSLS